MRKESSQSQIFLKMCPFLVRLESNLLCRPQDGADAVLLKVLSKDDTKKLAPSTRREYQRRITVSNHIAKNVNIPRQMAETQTNKLAAPILLVFD